MGTFTENLAIYKPTEGEDDWGDSVNAGFDAIDEAVNGIQDTLPETVVTIASSGTALTIDPALGTVWAVNVDANCAITLATPTTPTAGLTVKLFQDGSAHSISFVTQVGWEGGTEPTWQTADGHQDIVSFIYFPDVPGWFGFASALDIFAPDPAFPTLNFEILAAPTSSTANASPYAFGSSYQLGDKKLGLCWVVNTDATGNDPPTPTLSGGGASSWTQAATLTNNTAATTGRRITLFVARDEITGTPAALTVTVTGSPTGCIVHAMRTTGATPVTAKALAISKAVSNGSTVGGQAVSLSLAAPADAGSRAVMGLMFNNETFTYTPEANWTTLADTVMTAPSMRLIGVKNSTSFDTTPTGTVGTTNVKWSAIGTEVEQG